MISSLNIHVSSTQLLGQLLQVYEMYILETYRITLHSKDHAFVMPRAHLRYSVTCKGFSDVTSTAVLRAKAGGCYQSKMRTTWTLRGATGKIYNVSKSGKWIAVENTIVISSGQFFTVSYVIFWYNVIKQKDCYTSHVIKWWLRN